MFPTMNINCIPTSTFQRRRNCFHVGLEEMQYVKYLSLITYSTADIVLNQILPLLLYGRPSFGYSPMFEPKNVCIAGG